MATTGTYREEARRSLLKASRDLRAIAREVLQDAFVGAPSLDSLVWSKQTAAKYAVRANELEQEADGLGYGEDRSAATTKSHNAYADAVTTFQRHTREHYGEAGLDEVNAAQAFTW